MGRRFGLNREQTIKSFIMAILTAMLVVGCSDDPPPGLTPSFGFSSIAFVQRAHERNAGSLLNLSSPSPGASLLLLEPAAPGGKLTRLVDLADGSIDGLDVSPDGKTLVFGVRIGMYDRYHIVEMDLDKIGDGSGCLQDDGDLGDQCRRLTFGPFDDTNPHYLPGGSIAFTRVSPDGPVDFQGRGRSKVLMAVQADGSDIRRLDYGPGHVFGPRMFPDGSLNLVNWTKKHGKATFMTMSIDPTQYHGASIITSEIGQQGLPLGISRDELNRTFASCVAPVGTFSAGTICQQNQDGVFKGVVPGLPTGASCSPEGRVKDAIPIGENKFLVSYAKVEGGCVGVLDDDKGMTPDFGIAVLDARTAKRWPVYNNPDYDEVQAVAIMAHELLDRDVDFPQRPELGCDRNTMRIEGLVGKEAISNGAVGIRVLQGLSAALAPFAMTLGGSDVGAFCAGQDGTETVAPIMADGSFSVNLPSHVPLQIELIDNYGASVMRDPIWRGGPQCSERRCSACHSNDGSGAGFDNSLAARAEPFDLAGQLEQQRDFDFRRDIQPILSRSCAVSGCHDAETASGIYVDLSGNPRGLDLHDEPSGITSVAYSNLLFVDSIRDSHGRVVQTMRPYVVPGRARDSRLIQKLGVPCRYSCNGAPTWAPWGFDQEHHHPDDKAEFHGELTDEERWLLLDWVEAGAPFHGRGAKP